MKKSLALALLTLLLPIWVVGQSPSPPYSIRNSPYLSPFTSSPSPLQQFSGTAARVVSGVTLPTTCNPNNTNIFFLTSGGVGVAGIYWCSTSNVWSGPMGAGGGTPGGANTQLQYNNAGVFSGITGATTNGTVLTLIKPIIGKPNPYTGVSLVIDGGGEDITGSTTVGDFINITNWTVYATPEPLRLYGQTSFANPYVLNVAGIEFTGNIKTASFQATGTAQFVSGIEVGVSGDTYVRRFGTGQIQFNNGVAGQWASLLAGVRDAGTTTITNGLTIGHQSTGTPAANFGSALLFNLNSSTTADQNAAQVASIWTDPTHATRTASLTFNLVNGGAALAEASRITGAFNLKLAGTALRATTEGTNHLDIFDGTAPVGTLANGISLYSTIGELRVMDAAGNATLLSPHDKVDNSWIFDSKNTVTGKVVRIDVEKLLKFLNSYFGTDFVHEYVEKVDR